ncbi:MAG: MarR family transcriptional regulator [Acidimicrobiia bacterium]|nr:MarR family transcriptional regulator [Acidimicrobiia bacterium]
MVERSELTFVEEMGALFERLGYSRMTGRVWGYLLIVDAEQVSAVDLSEALDASPSAISTATRALISMGLVDRIRLAGERRDHFTIHHGAILSLVGRRVDALNAARDMAARALDRFGDREIARPHLQELYDVYSWFADEYPVLVDRFINERSSQAR